MPPLFFFNLCVFLTAYISVYDRLAWCIENPKEEFRASGNGIGGYSKMSPCRYWELNLDPLKEQHVSSLNQ